MHLRATCRLNSGKDRGPRSRLKCGPTVKFITRRVSPEKVSGKHIARRTATRIYGNKQKPSRNVKRTKKKTMRRTRKSSRRGRRKGKSSTPRARDSSRKLKKMEGGKESFHLRAAAEVGANGGLKSYAIERWPVPALPPRQRRSRRKSANSRRDQPVDPWDCRTRNYYRIYCNSQFSFVRETPPYLLIVKGGQMVPPGVRI